MHRIIIIFLCLMPFAFAETLSGWEGTNNQSTYKVDHSSWQAFLDVHLQKDDFGQTYFEYSKVGHQQINNLNVYLLGLQKIDPLVLNENEQKAYWINLYNAQTVSVILSEYPVKSIRNIGGALGGFIPTGPWTTKILTINNQPLSLDDIEHGIVRPKFNDYRVHYAFNCAAMGCPNLAAEAYSGENIEAALQYAENEFVNHQRGVRFQGGKLILSKIYDWYLEDFVDSEDDLTFFLAQFAEPKLRAQLKGYQGNIKYEYDWSLNEVSKNI